MTANLQHRATYADLEAVPPNMVAEILGGELVVHRLLRPRHAIAKTALGTTLGSEFGYRFDRPNGWMFLFGPELHLGADVIVPDIAAWRRERIPTQLDVVGITTPPDWACEVLSRDTAAVDRITKRSIYLREGVRHLWFLDPGYRTLETLKHNGGNWQVVRNFGGHDDVRAAPFDAISFSLGALWPYDPPPAAEGA